MVFSCTLRIEEKMRKHKQSSGSKDQKEKNEKNDSSLDSALEYDPVRALSELVAPLDILAGDELKFVHAVSLRVVFAAARFARLATRFEAMAAHRTQPPVALHRLAAVLTPAGKQRRGAASSRSQHRRNAAKRIPTRHKARVELLGERSDVDPV